MKHTQFYSTICYTKVCDLLQTERENYIIDWLETTLCMEIRKQLTECDFDNNRYITSDTMHH